MKSITKLFLVLTLLHTITSCNAQILNEKTESVKIYGNCGMCETTIEKAGSIKGIVKVDWNKDTKMATITFNSKKTDKDEILKRIALAGYDSDNFLAPDDAYSNLPGCCQYDRVKKEEPTPEATSSDAIIAEAATTEVANITVTPEAKVSEKQLKALFDAYFSLKDALVNTDGKVAAKKADDLLTAMSVINSGSLSTEEKSVWNTIDVSMKEEASLISGTTETKEQREQFMNLSKSMYALIKVTKTESPVYYQFCPMANDGKGANWLSKEKGIKNPYYGSEMLTCGRVVETIK